MYRLEKEEYTAQTGRVEFQTHMLRDHVGSLIDGGRGVQSSNSGRGSGSSSGSAGALGGWVRIGSGSGSEDGCIGSGCISSGGVAVAVGNVAKSTTVSRQLGRRIDLGRVRLANSLDVDNVVAVGSLSLVSKEVENLGLRSHCRQPNNANSDSGCHRLRL